MAKAVVDPEAIERNVGPTVLNLVPLVLVANVHAREDGRMPFLGSIRDPVVSVEQPG